MSRLARDGAAEPVSRDQILRRERGQKIMYFSCSADYEQDWRHYPIDSYIPLVLSPSETWFRGMSVGGYFRRV